MVKSGKIRISKIESKSKHSRIQHWQKYRVSYSNYLSSLRSQGEQFQELVASRENRSLRTRVSVNSTSFDDDLKRLYKMAVDTMMKTGTQGQAGAYGEIAGIHSDGSLFIHSPEHYVNHRFLPWHRIYLLEFERLLNEALGNEYNISIPYWDWEKDREIPDFFKNWTPKVLVNSRKVIGDKIIINPEEIQVARWTGRFYDKNTRRWYDIQLPTKQQIDSDVREADTFQKFTENLEGYHGTVHVYAGGSDPSNPLTRGTMGNIQRSPTDPLFWSHHANIDRIWDEWQRNPKNRNKNPVFPDPTLPGPIMNPFSPYTEKDTRNIGDLGYVYG
jgi:hypothetical protein